MVHLIRHWLAPASVHGCSAAVPLLPYWDSMQGFGLSHFQLPAAAEAAIEIVPTTLGNHLHSIVLYIFVVVW